MESRTTKYDPLNKRMTIYPNNLPNKPACLEQRQHSGRWADLGQKLSNKLWGRAKTRPRMGSTGAYDVAGLQLKARPAADLIRLKRKVSCCKDRCLCVCMHMHGCSCMSCITLICEMSELWFKTNLILSEQKYQPSTLTLWESDTWTGWEWVTSLQTST